MAETNSPYSTLSREEVNAFIENGFLVLRNCFSTSVAEKLVSDALDPKNEKTIYTRRTDWSDDSLASIPERIRLANNPALGRVDVDTQRYLSMADFCPRLWGAIVDLVGDERLPFRRHIGDKWILRFQEPDASQYAPSKNEKAQDTGQQQVDQPYFFWHIERPGLNSTLDYRTDALTLLIYWSDVDSDGGATLYSPKSLDGVLNALENEPGGTDTSSQAFGLEAVPFEDVRPFTGQPGDVVITHALCMHSGSFNTNGALRILENPSIDLKRPLDFCNTNPSPSPVEQCIISRLPGYPRLSDRMRSLREEGQRMVSAMRWLIHNQPDYFLPGRTRWATRISETEQARVRLADGQIFRFWVRDLFERSRNCTNSAQDKIEFGLYTLFSKLIGHPGKDSPLAFENPENPDFKGAASARLLRGFTSQAAFREVLRSYLAHHGFTTRLFEAVNPQDSNETRKILKIDTDEGWCLLNTSTKSGPFICPNLFEEKAMEGLPDLNESRRSQYQQGPTPLKSDWLKAGRIVERSIDPSVEPSEAGELPQAAATELPRPTAWQQFLLTRLDHLFFQCDIDENPYVALLQDGAFRGLTREVIDRLRKDYSMGEKPIVECEPWPSALPQDGPRT